MDRWLLLLRERLIGEIPQARTLLADSSEIIDRLINKLPRRDQGALCPAKTFGIIMLSGRCCGYARHRARSMTNAVIQVA
jgi:hypothetical protein